MPTQGHQTAFRKLVVGLLWSAAMTLGCAHPAYPQEHAHESRSSLWDPPGSASVGVPVSDTIKKTAQLIDGMGFTVKNSGADYIVIDNNGFNVVFDASRDGQTLYGNIFFQVPKDKIALVPYEQMMLYNGRSLPHFGIEKVSDDNTEIALIDRISASEMTPKSLKGLIDTVSGEANRNVDLFNPQNWKSSLPEFSSK